MQSRLLPRGTESKAQHPQPPAELQQTFLSEGKGCRVSGQRGYTTAPRLRGHSERNVQHSQQMPRELPLPREGCRTVLERTVYTTPYISTKRTQTHILKYMKHKFREAKVPSCPSLDNSGKTPLNRHKKKKKRRKEKVRELNI